MSEESIYYPNKDGTLKVISEMSKGYLKNEIAHIERTGKNSEFLDTLKKELRIRVMPKLKVLYTDEERQINLTLKL